MALLAYLDPGSGSIILQVLVGGFAAVAVTARLWWGRVLTFLRIRRPDADGERSAAERPDAEE